MAANAAAAAAAANAGGGPAGGRRLGSGCPSSELWALSCRVPSAQKEQRLGARRLRTAVGASPLKEQQTRRRRRRRRRRGACSRRVSPPPPLAAPPRAKKQRTPSIARPRFPYYAIYPRHLVPRARKAFTPWSSPLGGRLRTITATTPVRSGQSTVPRSDHGERPRKKNPAEPRSCLRHTCQITGRVF
jgi:hypothetical protein